MNLSAYVTLRVKLFVLLARGLLFAPPRVTAVALWRELIPGQEPVARGGQSTVKNVRLRCAGHNAYEAERAFGVEFMEQKQRQAREVRGARDRTHAARRE